MTALTASFILNGAFKNKHHSSFTVNGKRESKLEFVEAGILKPPELPSNVIKLVPRKRQTYGIEKSSPNYSNGFKHLFNKSDVYPNSNSPEELENPASSGSSNYPSEGNTPESITKSLTNVPSPKILQYSLKGGLEIEAEDDEDDENDTLKPPSIKSPPSLPIPKRVTLQPVTPTSASPTKRSPSPPAKIYGPQLPPGYILPSSSAASSPVKPTPASQKSLKRKRQISERCENESLYPVHDPSLASLNSWNGCSILKGKPALSGIRNPHNNCFLNSVLQSVCHIPQFGRFFLEHHPRNGKTCNGGHCLLCSLRQHFLNGLNAQVVEASWINKYLDDIFPSHVRGSQEDAHEMLLFLLDAIDRQQQRIRRSQPGKFSSIVEQVFDGKVRSEYTCNSCQKKSICYEPIRGLSIELPRNPDNPPEMANIVRDYFRDEKISGYDCRSCKKKTVASKRTRIVTAPRVLIIQLKRFLRFTKINTTVLINKNISVNTVMHDSQPTSYKLLGFIRHLGGSMSSGHYTATMLGFDGKNTFQFDDESRNQLQNPLFQKPIQPYILFYSRYTPQGTPNNSFSSKSPNATPAKKPNLNGISSQKNSFSTANNKKTNDNGHNNRFPAGYLSLLTNKK